MKNILLIEWEIVHRGLRDWNWKSKMRMYSGSQLLLSLYHILELNNWQLINLVHISLESELYFLSNVR